MSTQTEAVREVVALAGGKIVGKTRLQKSVYILELAGVGFDFPFSYHYYGPYSEDLSWASKDAVVDGAIREQEDQARWGGSYSVFSTTRIDAPRDEISRIRAKLLAITVGADAIALELAATAALLKEEGHADFWAETKRRKSLKATPIALKEAQTLWEKLRQIETPRALPSLG